MITLNQFLENALNEQKGFLKNVPVDVMWENDELIISSKAGYGDQGLKFYVRVNLKGKNPMFSLRDFNLTNKKAEVQWRMD